MEYGLGLLLALIAVAVTVTPAISNPVSGSVAWLLVFLYAGWLFSRHSAEMLLFVRDNRAWTTFSIALVAAVVAGGVWFNVVVPYAQAAQEPAWS